MVLDFGLVPPDSTGIPYEVHHVGQQADSLFAILTMHKARKKKNMNKGKRDSELIHQQDRKRLHCLSIRGSVGACQTGHWHVSR